MKVTLPQVNQFIDRISDSMTDLRQLAAAEEELKRYQGMRHDAPVQVALDRARVILWLKEEQAQTAAKVGRLVQSLMQCKQILSTHPQLTVAEYSQLDRSLFAIRAEAEPLVADDFILMSKPQFLSMLQICETTLRQRNPSAWKTDLLVRGMLTGTVMAFYAYRNGPVGLYYGFMGSLLAFGIEKGMGFVINRTARLFI